MKQMEILVLLVVVVLVVSAFLPRQKRGRRSGQRPRSEPTLGDENPKRPSIVARNIMGKGEQRFFRLLNECLPDHYIFPQMSLNALLQQAPHIFGSEYITNVRRQFHHKYVDFVVCSKHDMKVVYIIEYDGEGHDPKDDDMRDEMLDMAGYQVLRFRPSDDADAVKGRLGVRSEPVLSSGVSASIAADDDTQF